MTYSCTVFFPERARFGDLAKWMADRPHLLVYEVRKIMTPDMELRSDPTVGRPYAYTLQWKMKVLYGWRTQL